MLNLIYFIVGITNLEKNLASISKPNLFDQITNVHIGFHGNR